MTTHERSQLTVGAVLFLLGLAGLLVLFAAGCAGWQKTSRTTLNALSRSAELAPQMAAVACDTVAETCKGARDTVCLPLHSCHRVEREVARASVAAQAAALVGLASVEVADKPGVARALVEGVRALDAARRGLKAYGVVLP